MDEMNTKVVGANMTYQKKSKSEFFTITNKSLHAYMSDIGLPGRVRLRSKALKNSPSYENLVKLTT